MMSMTLEEKTLEEKLAARIWSQANPAAAKLRECLNQLQRVIGKFRQEA